MVVCMLKDRGSKTIVPGISFQMATLKIPPFHPDILPPSRPNHDFQFSFGKGYKPRQIERVDHKKPHCRQFTLHLS